MDIRYEDLRGYVDGTVMEHPGYVIGHTAHTVLLEDETQALYYLESASPTAYPEGTVQDVQGLPLVDDAPEGLRKEIQIFFGEEN